ncbi:1-phosphofructokinase family hexose kinase [Microvirga roseola]|uniref:1-phosphofructokinase family hexose kinase n=1 Tax=Microvirga roseola TaxID=2883126 RepID=UPI001E41145C|nr:1-phosphofructokinase family hexose kinase [Microvirga roseola]
MPDIVTLTMNPALDIATSAEAVVPTDKVRCSPPRHDPGGGGINVARVVRTLGGDALAVYPAGGPAGLALETLLERDGAPHRRIPIFGPTRESFTVDERRSGQQYRFVLPGPVLSEAEHKACLDGLAEAASDARFIVASGSLPSGVGADFYQKAADVAKGLGIRFVLDTSGEALRHMRSGVHLLKPSIRELREWTGSELRSEAQQIEAVRQLIGRGICEIIVISLGAEGALLVTEEMHERLAPIEVPVRSAVGAGDSMVAAITYGLARGLDLRNAIRLGMAAGAATVMTPGTELCRREDVERLYGASL